MSIPASTAMAIGACPAVALGFSLSCAATKQVQTIASCFTDLCSACHARKPAQRVHCHVVKQRWYVSIVHYVVVTQRMDLPFVFTSFSFP